jgi:hypothetical protein
MHIEELVNMQHRPLLIKHGTKVAACCDLKYLGKKINKKIRRVGGGTLFSSDSAND